MINLLLSLFLIHLWIRSISCAVYHIVPSPDHHCPVESCLTLTSFAKNQYQNQYVDSNILLIFQMGNHTIYSKFSVQVTNVANFSMIPYSANQLNTGIICERSSTSDFIFSAVDHIYISNLKFFGCRRRIFGFNSDNTLITVMESNLILLECTFMDNERTNMITAQHSNITILQSTIKNNQHTLNSQGILFFNGHCNVTIIQSIFIDNEGKILYAKSSSQAKDFNTLAVTGCEFRNNYANREYSLRIMYSEIVITDTKFISNRVTRSPVSAFKSKVKIDKCTFKYNYDSAIDLNQCIVDIFNSVYDGNRAVEYLDGGALISRSTLIHIHSSEFKNNTAKRQGGAIYCLGESCINFENCTLADNQAEQGGAIYLNESACIIAYGITVIIANNTASGDGGGIYLNYAKLTLHSHSTLRIINNRVTENGGGIYASELSSITLAIELHHNNSQITNSMLKFYRNQAHKGGALYLGFNSTVHTFVGLNNTFIFDKNSAAYGGAVYVFSNLSTLPYPEIQCFFQFFPHTTNVFEKCTKLQDCTYQ